MSERIGAAIVIFAALSGACSQSTGAGGSSRGGAGGGGRAGGGGTANEIDAGSGGSPAGSGGSNGGTGGSAGGSGGTIGAAGAGGATGTAGSSAGGRGGTAGGSGSGAAGASGGTTGAAGTTPIVFNPPACGKPIAGFQGSLCGPAGAPCRKLVDENADATATFRNITPALATDAQGRPHIVYNLNDTSLVGYYTVRDSGGWAAPETMPMKVASASLVVGADGLPAALVHSGSLPGTTLWKRDSSGWRRLDGTDIGGYESFDANSLVATQDGCFHASLRAYVPENLSADFPGYGLWNGHWNLTSFGYSQQGGIAPAVALAPDGTPHLAIWKYADVYTGVVDWVARGRSLEPVNGVVGFGASPTRAFISVAGGASGQDPVPYVFYRAVSGATATFPIPSKLVLSWRASNGTWSHQTMAESSGTTLASCGTATMSSPPCNVDYVETVPIGIVSSGGGDVRVFFTSTHGKGTWVAKCTTIPVPNCGWQPMSTDGGSASTDPTTFEMGWRNTDGTTGSARLYTTTISSDRWLPAVTLDVQGRIHIALYDGLATSTVRYLQFGP
jgi:hypothetical protein